MSGSEAVLPVTDEWDESDWEAALGEFAARARLIADGSDAGEMARGRIQRVIWMRTDSDGFAGRDIDALLELTDGNFAICQGGWDADFYKGHVYWGIGPTLASVSAELPPDFRGLWIAATAAAPKPPRNRRSRSATATRKPGPGKRS